MKKFTKFIKSWFLVILAVVSLIGLASYTGCVRYMDSTGQEVTRLSDESVLALDKVVEIAPVVQTGLTAASVAFPALAGVFSLVAGAIGACVASYKKYKPQLSAEHDKVELYGNTTKALVFAIEEFKATNTEEWETLKQALMFELKDKVGLEYFAIIDALRDAYIIKNK